MNPAPAWNPLFPLGAPRPAPARPSESVSPAVEGREGGSPPLLSLPASHAPRLRSCTDPSQCRGLEELGGTLQGEPQCSSLEVCKPEHLPGHPAPCNLAAEL